MTNEAIEKSSGPALCMTPTFLYIDSGKNGRSDVAWTSGAQYATGEYRAVERKISARPSGNTWSRRTGSFPPRPSARGRPGWYARWGPRPWRSALPGRSRRRCASPNRRSPRSCSRRWSSGSTRVPVLQGRGDQCSCVRSARRASPPMMRKDCPSTSGSTSTRSTIWRG